MQRHTKPRKTSFLRLLLLLSIFFSILWYFFLPPFATIKLYTEYYRPFNKQRKFVLVHTGAFGESEVIARLKIVCKKQKIDLRVFNTYFNEGSERTKRTIAHIKQVVEVFKPEFVLVFEEHINEYFPGVPNYVTLTRGGGAHYTTLTDDGKFSLSKPYMKHFDALLTSYEDTATLEKAYTKEAKPYFDFHWYSTVYATNYQSATPKKLFYSGGHLWDKTRSSDKYTEMFKKLDQSGYFQVCGQAEAWGHAPNSLIGQLPFDGKAVIRAIHEAGVSLILHSKEHLTGAAPTSRIFEASAANAVIITDRHPFIEKYFGDNVLYIDITQDANGMFKQINDHMQWILSHPTAAKALAQKCHDIYTEKFLLEDQLENLFKFDQEYKAYKNFTQNIKPSVAVDSNKVPPSLRAIIKVDHLPPLWAIIMVEDNNFDYYYNPYPKPHSSITWIKKLFALANQLERLKNAGRVIPDGCYVVSLEDGTHSAYPWPVLSFAADKDLVAQRKAVLMPDNDALLGYNSLFKNIQKAKAKYTWQTKQNKIFWRGQTTGLDFQSDKTKPFPRLQFVRQTKNERYVDAGFTHFTYDLPVDFQNEVKQKFPLQTFMSPADSLQFKYLFDIDGHSCSYSRMAWILYSNSLLLKHESNKVQWYYDKIAPYVHYLPIDADFKNLHKQFQWAQTHPVEVQQMTERAQLLAEQLFSEEAIGEATLEAFIKYKLLVEAS